MTTHEEGEEETEHRQREEGGEGLGRKDDEGEALDCEEHEEGSQDETRIHGPSLSLSAYAHLILNEVNRGLQSLLYALSSTFSIIKNGLLLIKQSFSNVP